MDNNNQNQASGMNTNEGQKALLKTLRPGYILLKAVTVILFILYLLSGLFIVNPNENVIILRFGKLVGDKGNQHLITSGRWHWAWPEPVDEIIRVPAKQVKTIHTDCFWYKQDQITEKLAVNHTNSNQLRPGIDGYLLTGDRNIVHSQWSISFLITHPVNYALNFKNPDNLIRQELHRAILQQTAQHSIHDFLYGNIETIQESVQNQTVNQLARLNIGVTVMNISCEKREPPRSTIPYFNKVSEANQEEKQTLDSAQRYAQKVTMQSRIKQARIIAEAEGYREKSIATLAADNEYFLKILEVYNQAPKTALINLYSQTLDDVFANVESNYIIHSDSKSKGQEVRIKLDEN